MQRMTSSVTAAAPLVAAVEFLIKRCKRFVASSDVPA